MNKKIFTLIAGTVVISSAAFAREFNSHLKLKVFSREADDVPDRLIGFTPRQRKRHIRVPEGKIWYVRPVGALSGIQLQDLAREMKQSAVPGLDLSDHWELSNESLRHLAALSQLQMLDLSRTRISDEGLADLKPFTHLSVLYLPAGITDRAAAVLAAMPSLRELGLDQTRLTNRGLSDIARLPALEMLDLSSTRVTDKGLTVLQKMPVLRRLTLGSLITDAGASHLSKLKTLQDIDVSQTQMGEKGLAALALLPRLRSVSLGRGVTDRGLSRLAASSSLKALDLSRTPVTDEGVKCVARIRTLEELALSQTGVGDQSLGALAQMPELRILDLSDTKVTSAGLASLAHLAKLEVLSLSWRKLTQDDLLGMAWLKQVKTIVLNGVPLPESTMAKLRRLNPAQAVAGLAAGGRRDTRQMATLAMALPVSIPPPSLRPGGLPEVPRKAAAPITAISVPDTLSPGGKQGPSRAAFGTGERSGQPLAGRVWRSPSEDMAPAAPRPQQIDAVRPAPAPVSIDASTLKETRRQPALSGDGHGGASGTVQKNALEAAAPAELVPKGEDDSLLQVITFQSNPARAGRFAGLSGMRQLQRAETIASLNTLATDGVQPSVSLDEDKPENALGEISVGVQPSAKKRVRKVFNQ